jgi:transposase
LRVFGELAPEPIAVAFEATIGWGWFADLLADAGVEAHMAHLLATRAIATARVKNDAVDAKTLAHLLRTHLLPEAWIAPLEVREARRLVRMRAGLVRIRTRLKCQIHALVAEAGVAVSMTDLFGRGGRALLADLRLPDISSGRLEANLRLIDTLSTEVTAAQRESPMLNSDASLWLHLRPRRRDVGQPLCRFATFPGGEHELAGPVRAVVLGSISLHRVRGEQQQLRGGRVLLGSRLLAPKTIGLRSRN